MTPLFRALAARIRSPKTGTGVWQSASEGSDTVLAAIAEHAERRVIQPRKAAA